ncbi:MAG: LacI family transcriptional regulator [Eubacterium sp.]|nr:LacI family transcriptional regulator [Eubacterium sp.]MCM1303374.1 LacI family transcriptional regulator [Butyrivibrio sp.]MCM1342573.1 LacI family transcriptional regulator [Muribaculaceae bacterium]MCM1411947.1 LacI family transcriptional regulator [Lachnospiraceae bacterium]
MTIEEMARELGVSKSTVSRALSGKGRIGDETRRKIVEFARQRESRTEYGTEGRNPSKNLGVILPADVYLNGGPYFQECILGICETSTLMDYDVLITSGTANDISGIRALVEKNKVDGIILTRSLSDDRAVQYLTGIGFPVGLTGICDEDIIQVDTDNEEAAESLTTLLIGGGYRRFALIIDNMDYRVNRSRHGGFCRALLKNGLSPEKQLIYGGLLNPDMVDSLISDVIARKVECIICGDDIICTKIMSSLQSQGYRIPRDVAVASLYNSPNLDCFTPSVTAVNGSARQVGNMIARQMINYLEGRDYQKKVMVNYEVLMRRSTKGML